MKFLLFALISVFLIGDLYAQSGQTRYRILFHKNESTGYTLSPDGQQLITFSPSESILRSIFVDSEEVRWSSRLPEGERSEFPEFAWSSDGLGVSICDQNVTCRLIDASSGKQLWEVNNPGFDAENVHIGKRFLAVVLFSKDEGRYLSLYDLKRANRYRSFRLGNDPLAGMILLENDRLIRIGDSSGRMTTLSVAQAKSTNSFSLAPCGTIKTYPRNVAFSPDIKFMVGRCGDTSVVTSIATRTVRYTVPMRADFEDGVSFSGDGVYVGLENLGGYKFLNLRSGVVKEIDDIPLGIIDRDGRRSVSFTDYKNRGLQIVDFQTGAVVKHIESHPGELRDLAFSPDGRRFASASSDGVVRVWDTVTRLVTWASFQFDEGGNMVVFSPDGRHLLTAGDRGDDKHELLLFDAATGDLIRRIPTENDGNDGILKASYRPDGRFLLTSGSSTSFKMWDTESWNVRSVFKTNESHTSGNMGYCCGSVAKSISFDRSGTKILSGHDNGTVKIWSRDSPDPIKIFKVSEASVSAIYSPDESKILVLSSSSHPTHLIDADTGSVTQTFRTGSVDDELDYVTGAVFSANGDRIFTTSWFDDVIEWSATTGKVLNRLDVGYSTEDVLRISSDGNYLLSGGENQNILLFNLDEGKLIWSLFPINRDLERIKNEKENERIASVNAEKEEKRLADIVLEKLLTGVYIRFSHYGDMKDPGQKKLVEKDEPVESKAKLPKGLANAVWLRLHNDSPLPIQFPTQSMYLPNKKCFFEFKNGAKIYGFCKDREVNVWHGMEDKQGKQVPYGFDFGSAAILLPKSSVLFPVPLELFENGNSIVFDYSFQNIGKDKKVDEYGNEKTLRFKAANLPE